MSKHDPAFPVPAEDGYGTAARRDDGTVQVWWPGLTKREFAALLIAQGTKDSEYIVEDAAKWCLALADAILEAAQQEVGK